MLDPFRSPEELVCETLLLSAFTCKSVFVSF